MSVCSTVTLSGASSSDSDGTVDFYSWTLTKPASSNSILDNAALPTPSFKADQESPYSISLVVKDNHGLASAAFDIPFTPIPNPAGQDIFKTNGLHGMTPSTSSNSTFNGKGPKCTDCHGPGTNLSGFNLSDSKYTVAFIKTKPIVTGGHTGTTTDLTDLTTPTLTVQLTALREYLDSTFKNTITQSNQCP